MLEAVTFDATGTLFHCPSLAQLYADAFNRHGLPISKQDVERLFPIAWKELDCSVKRGGDRFADHPRGAKGFWEDLLARLCSLAGTQPPNAFLSSELYQVFARGSSWTTFTDVLPALRELQQSGFRLAVISNWDDRLTQVLGDLGLAKHFETIVISEEVGHAKPDQRIFQHTLDRLRLKPIQVLHVGDHRINDFEGAAAAGLQAFLVNRRRGKDLVAAAQRARGSRL